MALITDNQNFALRRGESRLIFIELDVGDGSPFNPANSTMEWWVARSLYAVDDPDPQKTEILIKKVLNAGITIVTGPPSGINIELLATDTDLKPGYYVHELKVFLMNGGVSSAANGVMRVRPSLNMPEPP